MYIVGIIAIAVAIGLFFAARSHKGQAAIIAATETSTHQLLSEIHSNVVNSLGADALNQRCEIKGIIECDEPLSAPLSGTSCVAYRQVVSREYEEERTEMNQGKRETKVQRSSETVEDNDQRVKFWVRDATGRTLVDPIEARIDMKETGERYQSAEEAESDPSIFARVTTGTANRRTLGYRTRELTLGMGVEVYILGYAVDFQGQPMVARSRDKEGDFLISWKSEQELQRSAESSSRNFEIASYVVGALGLLLIVADVIF